jgi:hypothetical protein
MELRYSRGTDPATGKRLVVTTTVRRDRKAAERELRRLLRTVDTGEHVDPTRMTVRAWLTQWHEAVRSEVSPKTHERYGEIVNNFLIPALGALPLAKLTPSHIEKAYSDWASGGRRDGKPGGLAPLTRRYIHIVFKSALARAVEQQLLVRNPADILTKRLPKVARRDMNTLTTDESARPLRKLSTPYLLACFDRTSTGMRRGEVPHCAGGMSILKALSCEWLRVLNRRKLVSALSHRKQTGLGPLPCPAFCIEELRRLGAPAGGRTFDARRWADRRNLGVCEGRRRTVAASKPDASIHSPDNADRAPPPDQASRFAT